MDPRVNEGYFSDPRIVLDYARAAQSVGLWASEKILAERHLPKNARVLELGCGAGRIAFGLWDEGWRDIIATDFSVRMIAAAQAINVTRPTDITFAVEDATALTFGNGTFDAVIFGFNGLLMIPRAERRAAALGEIHRVLRPGGILIFTGHDRGVPRNAAHWSEEKTRWESGTRDPALDDFGDYNHATPAGPMFIHAADTGELRALLERCRFEILFTALRSEIAFESAAVREFSDDTRFWVVCTI